MMNKKSLIVIVCLLLAVCVLASCTNDADQPQQTGAPSLPVQDTEDVTEQSQDSTEDLTGDTGEDVTEETTEPEVKPTEEADDEENWAEIDWNTPDSDDSGSGEEETTTQPVGSGEEETTTQPVGSGDWMEEDPADDEVWGEEDWD